MVVVADFCRNNPYPKIILFQNETTKQEIQRLVQDKNVAELHKRFDERMEFGTAGKLHSSSIWVPSEDLL